MDRDPGEDSSPEPCDARADDFVFELPHIGETHALTGTTHADNIRSACARVELLDHLDGDPQFLARLEDWGHRIGLLHATEELARLAEDVAQYLGLEHRSDLWREREDDPVPQTDDAAAKELLHRFAQTSERWCTAIARLDELLEPVCVYVRDELQLNWPWLALEILHGLTREVWGHVLGVEMIQTYRLDPPPDPEVSPFEYTFRTRPGETLSAAQQRCIAEANEAVAQMHAVPQDTGDVPTGRLHKDLEETIRRYTRWFYRHRFRQENPYQIAKTYHPERDRKDHPRPFPQCSCYRNVLDGIREAERVLGLTPYFFRSGSEE
jgi:hypothetical protein